MREVSKPLTSLSGLRQSSIYYTTIWYKTLEDLDYADDICLLAQWFCDMEEKLNRLKEEAELVGLHININKTKGMRVNTSNMQKFRLEETEI